ncbi:phosphate ABC transporter substrate-binding protein PstS [Cellulomonas alba]|uniref:Phosphate-binding protein n=1 Tax=Cellulomonas alba TaxID=3053467 RepID=A0ABT7SGR6_9CELL|nr:phosphate ABC transporter substrate-binding protein PstS [Cellulomonas alba]MDM7855385.1 phosphate ABC transporter substrate-binding protein PstS [Cellulomonas alba]
MKLSLHGRAGAALALTGVLALTLAACGTDDNGSGNGSTSGSTSTDGSGGGSALSGELNGAGSTAQQKAMDAWRAAFQQANSGVTVNYDGTGSGAGRTSFISGAVDWAGSDSAMKPEELTQAQARCQNTEAFDVPVYVSPIAVTFNLKGVKDLNLAPATVAKIFDGKITTWNDAAIAADNPGVTLPSTTITPVHRSDDSGTTNNFTDFLSQAAGGAWSYPASQTWPIKGGESAQGTSGVVQTVQSGEGTIAYADLSAVGTLSAAKIKVGDAWVAPSADGAAKVLDDSPLDTSRSADDVVVKVNRTTTAAGAYPVILVSYAIACQKYDSAAKADLVKGLLTYIVSADAQTAAASAAGSAPITDDLRTKALAAINKIAG